jgi:nucleotide-binding universal stress UspA family protein
VLFRNVIVGADGSPEANDALRVALSVLAPDGRLTAVTVAEVDVEGAAEDWLTRVRAEADEAHAEAQEVLAGDTRASARSVEGQAARDLIATARAEGADLLALGSHGGSRVAGILFGSVATRVVHDAPCSVMVVRNAPQPGFPRGITVGTDGSECAAKAEGLAASLADGLGTELRRIADADDPVDDLIEASRSSDLVVVGSRGARGILALGSVAERVAHRAECAVLVVR